MHFRRSVIASLMAAFLLGGQVDSLCAQAPEVPDAPSIGDKHAWAQFGIGSWKLVRLYTETLGANGQVESVSITETKTTLDKADDKGYSLKVEVTIEVAGKRFQAEPKYVSYGYHGEQQGQAVEVTQVSTGQTLISAEKYETVTRRIVITNESDQSTSIIEYSSTVPPYNLKRTTESIDKETKHRNYHSVVEVVAVGMPAKVLTEVKSAAHVKTIETFSNGTTKVTLEVSSESVPGGVVSHTSKQVNTDKQVTQRSTLELLDYEVISKPVTVKKPLTLRRRILPVRRRGQ